jgi:hypothetical protein
MEQVPPKEEDTSVGGVVVDVCRQAYPVELVDSGRLVA